MRHQCSRLVFCLVATLFAPTVSAQLIAYEPFDYAQDAHIFGTDGGVGWLDAWVLRSDGFDAEQFTAQGDGLSYTDASGNELTVSGNYGLADFNGFEFDEELDLGGNVQMYREVVAEGTIGDLVGGGGNSYYISFIGERRGASNFDALGSSPHAPNEYSRNAHLSLTTVRGNEEAQIGNPSNQTTDTWKIRAKDSPDADSDVQFSYNQSFVVTKVTVGDLALGEADQIEMWINPVLTSEAAAGAPSASHVVRDDEAPYIMNHTGIGAYVGSQSGGRAGGVMAFDEIRIGHTWEDVTPFDGTRDVGLLGDFDADEMVAVSDADLLVAAIASTGNNESFDLTNDGLINADDLATFLSGDLISTGNKLGGDVDLNGAVEFADFLSLSANFGQDIALWSAGDFDANGSVAFADFLILSQNFGQTAASVSSVPEPSFATTLYAVLIGAFVARRSCPK